MKGAGNGEGGEGERTKLLDKDDDKNSKTFYFLNRTPSQQGDSSKDHVDRDGELVSVPPPPSVEETPPPAAPPNPVMQKLRKVPVKVEPKVFFANERTFISWMHMGVTLASISIAILAMADQNEWSTMYGLTMLPVSIAFILYAMLQYMRRAAMIRRRSPGPYDDIAGPIVLATMLSVAIVLNFAVKLYALY